MALKKVHREILKLNDFVSNGTLKESLLSDEWDGSRVLYAISDPKVTRVVYVGDSERGRNLRSRLKAHMKDRTKKGLVELKSRVWVHFMVTECSVLWDFKENTGMLPELNRHISAKHPRKRARR